MEDEFIKKLINDSHDNWDISATFKEIQEEVKQVVKDYYKPYNKFEKNNINLKNTLNKLKDYVYLHDNDIIHKGRYIRFLSNKYFYDIVLHIGGNVIDVKNNIITILTNGKYIKINKVKNDKRLFMKLTNSDKFRAFLNECGEDVL